MIVKKRVNDKNDMIFGLCLVYGGMWLFLNVLYQYQFIIYKMNPNDYDLKQGVIIEIEKSRGSGRGLYWTYTTIAEVDSKEYEVVYKYGDEVGATIELAINNFTSQKYYTRNEYLILSFCFSTIAPALLICFIVLFILWLGIYFGDRKKKKKYKADIDILKTKLLDKYGFNNLLNNSFDIYNMECVRKLGMEIPYQMEWCLKNLDCSIFAEKIPSLRIVGGIPEFILKTLDYRKRGLSEKWIVCCIREQKVYCIEVNDEKIYSISQNDFNGTGQLFSKEYDGFLHYVANILNIK